MEYALYKNKYIMLLLNEDETEKMMVQIPDFSKSSTVDLTDIQSLYLLNILYTAEKKLNINYLFSAPFKPIIIEYMINENAVYGKSTAKLLAYKQSKMQCSLATVQNEKIKIKPKYYIYQFTDFFDAVDAVKALNRCKITPTKCSLFSINNTFYIQFKISRTNKKIFKNLMLEFGEKCSSKYGLFLLEHSKLIEPQFFNFVVENKKL